MPLTEAEIRVIFRDSVAKLRRCRANEQPDSVTRQSVEDLRFDTPPLRMRPHHEKRALSYVLHHELNERRVFVHPTSLPVDYFKDNSSLPLDRAVDRVFQEQEPA